MINTGWLTTMKETFQVLEKIALLTKESRPDGNLKKQLTHINLQLQRLECLCLLFLMSTWILKI